MPLKPPSKRLWSIDEKLHYILRERLLNGQYRPGQWLYATDLEKEFGVSRTPIRNALSRLEVDGLIQMIPRKGAMVPTKMSRDVLEMFDLLQMLEMRAVELAVTRGKSYPWDILEHWLVEMERAQMESREDDLLNAHVEFHQNIYKLARSPKLLEFLENLTDALRASTRSVYDISQQDKQTVEEHRAIFQGMRTGNVSLAIGLIQSHIARARDRYNLKD